MNQQEYEWVKQTRDTLLNFCDEITQADFTREMAFGFESVRNTLIHIVDCYHAWIGSYVLLKTLKPITPKENRDQFGIKEIKQMFVEADAFVEDMFVNFGNKMELPIERAIPWREKGEVISISPGKLFTHTVTHEYHHKGQIMVMARLLGYEPPNTDVLGTDD